MSEQEVVEEEWQVTYRYGVLLGLGLPYEDANALKAAYGVTLYDVRQLLGKGCPPELVRSILE